MTVDEFRKQAITVHTNGNSCIIIFKNSINPYHATVIHNWLTENNLKDYKITYGIISIEIAFGLIADLTKFYFAFSK